MMPHNIIFFLFILVMFFCVVQRSSSSIITVPALPENVLATGYSGLQLKTEIQRATSYNRCRWIYNENVIDIFTPKFSCKNRTESFFELTCVKTNSVVTTRLTIFTPVESDVNASVQCLLVVSGETISSIFLHVTDCSVVPPLVVYSASASYNSSGTFSCANNGTLFYSNETQATSTRTTCLATAEWSGQDGLECWKAPTSVQVLGNLTAVEGSSMTLFCSYQDEYPNGSKSLYYFGNNQTTLSKDQLLTIASLKKSDNSKSVSCQAMTRFTEIYPEKGKSDVQSVTIWYKPYQNETPRCAWIANVTQSCKISYYANTNTPVLGVTKNGQLVNTTVTSGPSASNDVVSLYYEKQASIEDVGTYKIILKSVVPPYNHTIYFDIVMYEAKECPISTVCTDTSVIALIVVSVYAVIATIAAGAISWKLHKKSPKKKNSKVEHVYEEANDANVNAEQTQGDRTYLELNNPLSSPVELQETNGYLTPMKFGGRGQSTAAQSINAGYVNCSVTECEDVDNTTQTDLSSKPAHEYDDVISPF